jgi:iron complex outermembrane recepter protein
MSKKFSVLMNGLLGLVLVPFFANAAVLEEVIVTAQKREQSLSDIGISVTAFTGEQIRELGFTNTVDVVSMTPGFNYTIPNAEGSQINFFLRGVGLNDFQDVNENPVGAYFDDVYRGAMGGLHLQLFDMERVEVLRGPQGTLYGRNTTGGLVHFISKKPTEDFEGYGEVSFGSFDEIKFEGAVGGAISEQLLGRISIATNNNSGYVDNRIAGVGDFNETDSIAVRGQLLWKATNDIELLAKIHYSKNDSQVGGWQHQVSVATQGGDNRRNVGPTEDLYGAGPGNDAFGYRDTDGDPHAGDYDRDGKVKVEADGISGKLTWAINENLTLVNIAAFDLTDRLQEEDTEASPAPLLEPTFGANTDQWTEELRLHGDYDDLRWVAGFYYFNQEVIGKYLLDTTNLGFIFFDADIDQNTESWSTFGQIEYDFAPELTVTAGLRFTDEKKELNFENLELTGLYDAVTAGFIPPAAFGLAVAPPLSPSRPTGSHAFLFNQQSVGNQAKHDKTNLTGKIGIDYRPNEDLLIYASFSRGVKSAGFNTGFLDATFIFASNTVDTIPFDDETLHSYEIGFKSTFMDGKVRLNGAAFYYDYNDFQTFRFELLNAIIFNTDAEVFGGELELQASPWEGWDFMLGLSVLDATAENIPSAGTGTPRNRTMVAAPDVTLTGLARYEWPSFNGTAAVLAKFHYQSETFYDIQNYDNAKEDGYIVGDVRAQWTSADEHWQLAAFINNVGDTEYITYTFDFAGFGFNQEAYGKPRWFGGSIGYSW